MQHVESFITQVLVHQRFLKRLKEGLVIGAARQIIAHTGTEQYQLLSAQQPLSFMKKARWRAHIMRDRPIPILRKTHTLPTQ